MNIVDPMLYLFWNFIFGRLSFKTNGYDEADVIGLEYLMIDSLVTVSEHKGSLLFLFWNDDVSW